MTDYIEVKLDDDLNCYSVNVVEYFDPFGNEDFFDTYESAIEHAIELSEHHKVEVRVLDENGKLKEIIVNGLL